MLCNWEGLIVKFLDDKEQEKVIKGEEIFENFVKQYRDWVDPNT